jgi:hypothetical protein
MAGHIQEFDCFPKAPAMTFFRPKLNTPCANFTPNR